MNNSTATPGSQPNRCDDGLLAPYEARAIRAYVRFLTEPNQSLAENILADCELRDDLALLTQLDPDRLAGCLQAMVGGIWDTQDTLLRIFRRLPGVVAQLDAACQALCEEFEDEDARLTAASGRRQ